MLCNHVGRETVKVLRKATEELVLLQFCLESEVAEEVSDEAGFVAERTKFDASH